MDREIPVIADAMVDPKFGTGVVKITPAHDPNDFEAGKRHNLPLIRVIGTDARMTAEAGAYAGLDRFEARKRIVAALERIRRAGRRSEDYTVKHRQVRSLEDHRRAAGLDAMVRQDEAAGREGHRGGGERAHRVRARRPCAGVLSVDEQHPRLVHFAPAVVGASHSGLALPRLQGDHRGARDAQPFARIASSTEIEQETDVLDTWFSSGLWPFSTLGWPDQTEDLKTFYPTSLLITGFDILFFWVARMIMLGLWCMGDVPFRQVHMHGLVRDAERQKMSKTKGNVIDPLELIERVRHRCLPCGAADFRGAGRRYRVQGRPHRSGARFRQQDLERLATAVPEYGEERRGGRGSAHACRYRTRQRSCAEPNETPARRRLDFRAG